MGILDQYINTPEIQQAQTASDQAFNTVQQYGASMGGLPEKLRQAVLEKYNYNKDLIEQRNKAAADYFATPATAREKYADIGNPMLTEKLVAQDKAIMYQPWANLNDILSARMGTIDKTAQGLAQTAQSEYEMSKLSYEAARQKLQDLLGMAKTKADYDLEERKLASGGSGDSLSLLKWIAAQKQPTATQETLASSALSALSSIESVRSAMKKDKNILRTATNPVFKLFNPNAQVVEKDLMNIRETIMRMKSGAQINDQEKKFYEQFVADPIQTMLGYTGGTEKAFSILEGIFNRMVKQTENPYMNVLEQLMMSQLGGGDDFTPDQ